MTGNKIPDSYLRKFWPVQDKQDEMPADLAAFVRDVVGHGIGVMQDGKHIPLDQFYEEQTK